MFPIATNLKLIRTPWATYAIIGTNVLIHLIVTWNTDLVIPSEMARTLGFVPGSFGDLSTSYTLVTCMFLHGDLIHLSGNMLFLLVFGRRVETQLGAMSFVIFYLTGGITACLAHTLAEPDSSIPLIGASGAISGVLGAFLISNPRARITLVLDPTLIYFFRRLTVPLPAWFFLLGWFLLQLGLALKTRSSNIAFWAHVGGFVMGILLAVAVYRYIPKRSSDREQA
jgi:membrane associated rhomboid family serine protease